MSGSSWWISLARHDAPPIARRRRLLPVAGAAAVVGLTFLSGLGAPQGTRADGGQVVVTTDAHHDTSLPLRAMQPASNGNAQPHQAAGRTHSGASQDAHAYRAPDTSGRRSS